MGLFQTIQPEEESRAGRPLADRMRPQTLDEFIGQEESARTGETFARADRARRFDFDAACGGLRGAARLLLRGLLRG